ncbi:MAG: SAVED domain-containing protein [Polyangiaceae bacterium]|nr:SAVED domain-containing protein [Polyangiaceae bacterium]
MKELHPIVVILDVAQVLSDELLPLLPEGHREPTLLRLSEEILRRPAAPGEMKGPYDWEALGRGVESLAGEALRLHQEVGGALHVAGRAPLPLFVQLGYSLNKFVGEVWVLNPYRGGPWVQYPAWAAPQAGTARFFDTVTGLQTRSQASGIVSVYVSTLGSPAPEDAFFEAIERTRHPHGGVVEIRTGAAGDVTAENVSRIADELHQELPRVKDTYPRSEGMALFVAGPVPLAFLVGRSLNFHAQRDLWVMSYDRGGPGVDPGYEVAVTLPFRAKASTISDTAEDRLARREALDAMIEGIEELRTTLKREDLPPGDAAVPPQRYMQFLRDLRFRREPEGDAFGLSVAHREMSVGRGLLEAVRGLERGALRRFAQLLVLHELHHDGHDLRTSSYAEIGRAGVVLEEIDFWADAFSLSTLIAWDLRQGGPRAQARLSEIAAGWIDTAISGIEAFDRFDHGARIDRLFERRLRRYLIWHLQHERAATVRARDDVRDLFRDRLFVELAPLDGSLDPRGDKLVTSALPGRTEICAVLRGHLVRQRPRPGFEPSLLVDAARGFERDAIRKVMRVLVEEHRSVLVPWTAA